MVKHNIGDSVFKHELDLIAVNVQIWRAWDELGLSLCQGPKIIIEVNATGEKKKNGDSKVPVYFFLRFMVFVTSHAGQSIPLNVKIKINRTFDGTYFAVLIACCSFCFHNWATSLANGSSGFGAERSAWIDKRTVRICKAGDHLSFRISCRGIKSEFNEKGTLAG